MRRLASSLLACMIALVSSTASAQTGVQGSIVTVYGDAVSIPTVGTGTPYPSSIIVPPETLVIDRVTVSLHGLTHAFPRDLRIMLSQVGTGATVLLMQDAGGSAAVSNVDITFDTAAPTAIPQAGPLNSGVYRPSVYGTPIAALVAPAPAGPFGTLAGLASTVATGTWNLWIQDAFSPDGGNLRRWSITFYLRRATLSHPFFNINSPSLPSNFVYPATLRVSDFAGPVESVVAKVNFSHSAVDDLDILLAAPDGRSVVLMSDVAGPIALSGAQWEFSDTALANLPASGAAPPLIGTFRPTNYDAADTFRSPAPPAPYGATMSALNGGPANGTWKLFVVDDEASIVPGTGVGFINSWSLVINGEEFCPADFNRSRLVSVQDIFDFLAAYFAGCP